MKHPSVAIRHYDRETWITLAVLVVLSVFSVSLSIYRFSLPTDGWEIPDTEPVDSAQGGVLSRNILGLPSGLQEGDVLVKVAGVPYIDLFRSTQTLPDAAWKAGNTITYTVLRNGQAIDIPVQLVHWGFGTLWANLDRVGIIADLLALLVPLVVSLFTFFKRPHDRSARALLVLFVVIACSYSFSAPWSNMADVVNPLASYGLGVLIVSLFTILFPPSMLRFTLVFPKPKPILLKYPWLEYLPYLIGLVLIPLVGVTNGAAGWAWTIASIVGSIISLIHSAIIHRDTVSRVQMRWGVGGFVIGLGMFLASYPAELGILPDLWNNILNVLGIQGFMVIGVTLAIAILRYRLFDIDLIIRRTLIYGVVTGLLALVYFSGVALFQSLFSVVTGEKSPLAVVISTLAIAALFTPLRKRVQVFVDRRFYRRKYDAEQTLETFSETMRDEVDLDRMTLELVNVVEKTIQPEHIGLWLASESHQWSDAK